MWFYGINFRRLTNWDIALHFTPEISIWDNDYKEKNTNEGLRSGFNAGISYNNYKPVNMFWQFDINASVDFNYIYDDYFTNNNSIDKKGYLSPYLGAKLTNFISTRAYFSTSLINQFNYLIYENSNKPISYSYYVSSKNNFVYYLSPATSLNVNLDFGYSLNKHDNDFYSNFQNGFGHTFKIGFNHYFY
jgi:hypothetical protein